MKARTLSIILIFSLALNLAVVGTFIFRMIDAPPDSLFPPGGPDKMPFFNEMGLDENQRDEMFRMMHEFRHANRENRRIISKLEHELFQAIRSENADSTQIDQLVERIGQLRIEHSKQAINHFRQYKDFLTPRQQDHFFRMLQEKRPGRKGMNFGRQKEYRRKWRNSQKDSSVAD